MRSSIFSIMGMVSINGNVTKKIKVVIQEKYKLWIEVADIIEITVRNGAWDFDHYSFDVNLYTKEDNAEESEENNNEQ